MVSKAKLNKYLDINKSHVFTKIPARIVIDLTEHRNIDDQYAESIGIEQVDNVYKIPGFYSRLINLNCIIHYLIRIIFFNLLWVLCAFFEGFVVKILSHKKRRFNL